MFFAPFSLKKTEKSDLHISNLTSPHPTNRTQHEQIVRFHLSIISYVFNQLFKPGVDILSIIKEGTSICISDNQQLT